MLAIESRDPEAIDYPRCADLPHGEPAQRKNPAPASLSRRTR
jgi:hypothetical protein